MAQQSENMGTQASGPTASILIVDDEEAIRKLLATILRQDSYDIMTASDGLEAKGLIEAGKFDVVITDLSMPQMGGIELMQWAQENHPGSAWIILSGHATVENAVNAVHLGAFDFIRKPLDIVDGLRVTVRNALQQQWLAAEREQLTISLGKSNRRLEERVLQLSEAYDMLAEQANTIGQDLRRAELIQRALLPCEPPSMRGLSANTIYRPCHNVGGDLYEVVRAGENHLMIYVADAAGHGVSAAMLAVLFKHRIAVLDDDNRPRQPAEILASVNRALMNECGAPGLFITAAICMINMETWEMTVASAGHPPLLLARADGQCERVYHTGPALGFLPRASFAQATLQLQPDDRLLLYTDGLFDAEDPAKALRCSEMEVTLQRREIIGQEVLGALLATAQERSGHVHLEDDITLVLLTAADKPSEIDNGVPEPVPIAPGMVQSPQAKVLTGHRENTAWFSIQGRANWTYCAAFHEECFERIDEGKALRFDLSLCTLLDSTFLGTIYEVVSGAKSAGTEITLQGVLPEIDALFEELGMELVRQHMTDEMQPLPTKMSRLGTSKMAGSLGDAKQMLAAHETLVNISEHNKQEFMALVKGLQMEVSQMEAADPPGDETG